MPLPRCDFDIRQRRRSAPRAGICASILLLALIVLPCRVAFSQPTPTPPSLPVFGFVAVPGENVGVPGFEHDDWGPLPEVMANIVRDTGLTCMNVGGTGWRRVEPVDSGGDPNQFDWTLLHALVEPFLIDGVVPIAYATFAEEPDWLTEPYGSTAYWDLAERYMRIYIAHLNEMGVYHFIFENEPNMLARPDWPDYHMERLQHGYTAIKAVNPANQVIAGNLSEDAAGAGHYDLLYQRGLKNYSDIIGLHPYSDNYTNGLDIGDAAFTHQIMVNWGDGDKKMFLGEGWGPKRELPDFKRGNPADRPNRAEIDRLRAFMENGYNTLMTPSGGWDPNWLFGALFFTLNDNLCCRHWAERATPVPGGCLIDGIFMDGCNLTVGHFNGGLIDMYGNPKSDIIWGFPNGSYRPSPTPVPLPPTIGPNLVANGDFEGGFQPDGAANGWSRYDTTATGQWGPAGITHGGAGAQSFGMDGVGFDGGIVQNIPTVNGNWYAFTSWITYDWYNLNDPDTCMTVGYDTSGQTSDPRAFSSFWNIDFRDWYTSPGAWIKVEMLFQATGDWTSVWFRGGQEWAAPWYYVIVDDVEVRQCQSPYDPTSTPTTTPSGPTLTSTITPTSTATSEVPPTPIVTERLLNGDMELGTPGTAGEIPDYWTKWDGGSCIWWYGTDYGRSGRGARVIGGAISGTTFDGGIYQRVTGLNASNSYIISGWANGVIADDGSHWTQIGYDLSGGTNPYAPSVVWVAMAPTAETWTYWESGEMSPVSNSITVFTRGGTNTMAQTFFSDFDDFNLLEIGPPEATATPTQTIPPIPTATPTEASVVTERLLNGDMELGTPGTAGEIPDYWTKWDGGSCVWWLGTDYGRSGQGARVIGGAINGHTFDGGIYQRVTGLNSSNSYIISGWANGIIADDGSHWTQIGYDLTGGTNPYAPSVVWIAMAPVPGTWTYWDSGEVNPVSNSITVFTRGGTNTTAQTFYSDFDDFSLLEIGEPAATPLPTSTDTPPPTSTPTVIPTGTDTATATSTPTATSIATDTATPTGTGTFTPTPTGTRTIVSSPTEPETSSAGDSFKYY